MSVYTIYLFTNIYVYLPAKKGGDSDALISRSCSSVIHAAWKPNGTRRCTKNSWICGALGTHLDKKSCSKTVID